MNDKINGYYLDCEQQAIVLDESKYLLVVAGAGSGKTLTILGKINYLVKYKNIKPDEILCISFTKASATSLKDKIKHEFLYDMPVYTFHKLSLEILKENKFGYEIADDSLLDDICRLFFRETIYQDDNQIKYVLKYFNQKIKYNFRKQYILFYKNNIKKIILLERLITTFIHLMKCNNYSLSDFNLFLKQARFTLFYSRYKHEKYFLILVLNIYFLYKNYLDQNNEIDFDDMIIKATDVVENIRINKKYKYVIIDEYQDTSLIRFNLVKAILLKTNANLMVVGDDFQSIYKFTGCELSLFLNFKDYFTDSKIMKIQSTYRNSQELIKIAGDFVMKNKKQIHKKLVSNKKLENPIQFIYYDDIKSEFKKLIEKIYFDTNKPILILGRNNKDIYLVLDNDFELKESGTLIYKKNKNINLYYLTVHKSKGLEEENVIIINMCDNLLGFPNKIKDDKLLRFVSHDYDKFPYNEERRLFYVALTRTKNYVYLLVPKNKESIFIKELVNIINRLNKKGVL